LLASSATLTAFTFSAIWVPLGFTSVFVATEVATGSTGGFALTAGVPPSVTVSVSETKVV